MSDFPKGGDIGATRTWLDRKGFDGVFVGWEADAILGKSDEFIKTKFPKTADGQDRAEILCGLLNTARQQAVPATDGVPQLLMTEFNEGLQKVQELAERIERAVQLNPSAGIPPPMSFSTFGKSAFSKISPTVVAPITKREFDLRNKNEEDLNAELAEFLVQSSIVEEDDIVCINSERHSWLPCTEDEVNDLNPDFLVIHRAFFVQLSRHGNSPESVLFGKAHRDFVDQVLYVHEGKKVELDNDCKGRIAQYLYHLCAAGIPHTRGLLFNHKGYIHVEMSNGQISKVVQGDWDEQIVGAVRPLILPYRYPPLTQAVIFLCKHFGVQVEFSDAVLGKGAFGSVFKVKRGETRLAMKVVVVADASMVVNEVHYMKMAFRELPNIVVAIEGDVSLGSFENGSQFAGYIMTEVGEPIKYIQQRLRQLFLLLQKLHEKQIAHNDARISNIVYIHGVGLKLIDFRHSTFGEMNTPFKFQQDMRTLAGSILQAREIPPKDEELSMMVQDYDLTESSAEEIAMRVMSKWQKQHWA